MAVLFRAQNIARPADLQVTHGNLDAGAQLRKLPDGLETLLRLLPKHLVTSVHEKRIGSPARPAHAPPQLVQLGKSHAVRILYNHRIGIGNIESRLDDGGADKHIDLPIDEIKHDALQLMLVHLAMGEGH